MGGVGGLRAFSLGNEAETIVVISWVSDGLGNSEI